MHVRVRAARPGDAAALSAMAQKTYAAAFGHSFLPSDLEAILGNRLSQAAFDQTLRHDVILLAMAAGAIVGYVQFGEAHYEAVTVSNGAQAIHRLYVLSECQNLGIGSRLIQRALAHPRLRAAQDVYLDVWEHNPSAQRLYRRFGFAVVGEERFVVASGGDTSNDLIMVRHQP